jgi:putative flippase GtrA
MGIINSKFLSSEKARFIIAGTINTSIDFLLLNAFVFLLHILPLTANIISVTIGITISYFLNHFFVFREEKSVTIRAYLTFFAITGLSSLVIQDIVIFSFEQFFKTTFSHSIFLIRPWLAGHPVLQLNVAKAAAVGVGMIWNFLLYKHVVFKKDSDKRSAR